MPANRLFRFEASWLRHPGASEVITESWNCPTSIDEPARRFSRKIDGVSGALKIWSAGQVAALRRHAEFCLLWMAWLDKAEEHRLLVPGEASLRVRLKVRYDELSLLEEVKWKQHSRVRWLKVGDANTRFFHLKASARRSRNFIAQLKAGPATIVGHGPLQGLLFDFFKRQLGTGEEPPLALDFSLFFAEASRDFTDLQVALSEAEVRSAVFSSAPDRAPGPDGFPLLFYQRYWGLIREDVLEVFSKFHSGAIDLSSVNRGWICLIPKKSGAGEVRDFRPIFLVNAWPRSCPRR